MNLTRSQLLLLCLSILVLVIGCNGSNSKEVNAADVVVTDTIISYEKKCLDTLCGKWNINASDVLHVLAEFDTLSGYDWHQCYGTFRCEINGEIVLGGGSYFYSLNAGGWARMRDNDHEIFIGSRNLQDSIHFLSINFCNEEWD